MSSYRDPLQKRAINSAIVCIASVFTIAVLSALDGPGQAVEILLCLAILSTIISFARLLVFAVRFSRQRAKDKHHRTAGYAAAPTNVNYTDNAYPVSACPENPSLDAIDSMEGLQFEHWCADLLRHNRFDNVVVTQASGDQGVDVLAEKDGIKYAIQCKCYSSDLGNTPVQEVNAGKIFYNCHVGAVMTNRHFTTGAKQAAEATGVLLWDRDWIQNAITKRKSGNP